MYFVIRKKIFLIITLFVVLTVSFGLILQKIVYTKTLASPIDISVVIDAGHGGIDGGSVGVNTGITENQLNLVYANKLEKLLRAVGINVYQTRTSLDGLYETADDNFKKSDMEKRKEIIENINPNLVVSIHMNKFSLSSENGAQVFYNEENENGKKLADNIRDELIKRIDNARELTLSGDYYMVKCTNIPTVIVECGFLSNPEEELSLQNEDYQDTMCYSIFCGIFRYLNIGNY